MSLLPMDEVTWFRVSKGRHHGAQKIPAVVKWVSKFKVAIQIKDSSGTELVRYVPIESVEKRRKAEQGRVG